ncbi:Hypothetical predicted protein, partial [Marmota monax]
MRKVRRALLNFIETLSQYDYLTLSQGNVVIDYLIKLSLSNSSNEEDIRIMCFKILQMVSLPILITLVCHPSNILAFVTLSKAATEIALKARTLGQVPYLSSFHLMRRLPSETTDLSCDVGQVWKKEIPQMLRILDDNTEKTLNQKEWEERLLHFSGRSLVAINDDDWLEKLAKTILEKINYFNDDEEK